MVLCYDPLSKKEIERRAKVVKSPVVKSDYSLAAIGNEPVKDPSYNFEGKTNYSYVN